METFVDEEADLIVDKMVLDKMVADKMVRTKWHGQNVKLTKCYQTKW